VLDALKDTIKQIEAGEINPLMVYVAMVEDVDGGGRLLWSAAGTTDLELGGLLGRHLARWGAATEDD
jgi:hypothetical protein